MTAFQSGLLNSSFKKKMPLSKYYCKQNILMFMLFLARSKNCCHTLAKKTLRENINGENIIGGVEFESKYQNL